MGIAKQNDRDKIIQKRCIEDARRLRGGFGTVYEKTGEIYVGQNKSASV